MPPKRKQPSAAKERSQRLLREREERDSAVFAESLRTLKGNPGFLDRMSLAVAAVAADAPDAIAAIDNLTAYVAKTAPDLALLQRGEDLRRFITQAVLVEVDRSAGVATDAAIQRNRRYGPVGFHLPGNSGRVYGSPRGAAAEITPDLTAREQRELLDYIALFRDKDPGGRPRKDAAAWRTGAVAVRDDLRRAKSREITEEELSEKLEVEVRTVQRWLQRCGLTFSEFLALP